MCVLFLKQKTAYEMRISDWSSDVCSSDLLEHIEDRAPASAKLGESLLDEPRGPLRPGIDIGPGERAGKGRVRRQAEASARLRRQLDLLDRPRLPLGGLAADVLRREAVEQAVVRRMHRAKQIGRASCRERECQDV